jgi:hypothetical protein
MYPAAARKKVRKELRKLMKCAEQVRSADIAIDLLTAAGIGENEPLVRNIREQRTLDRAHLHDELIALSGHSYTKTWREGLGL